MAAFRKLRRWGRLFRTVRDLKVGMIGYRLIRRVAFRPTISSLPEWGLNAACSWPVMPFQRLPVPDRYVPEQETFEALNLPPTVVTDTVWTSTQKGLLWNFHLNSLNWLEQFTARQPQVDALLNQRASLPYHWHADAPYPQSLRIQSIIRYLLRGETREEALLQWLWRDYQRLQRFPEYQLDGNHLLENFLAAYSAALFFSDTSGKPAIEKQLSTTLQAQFLEDGGHYERSIHYTAQLTASMIKTLGLAQQTQSGSSSLLAQLKQTIAQALGWIGTLQFGDGSYPAFGDSHPQLYPSLPELQQGAAELGILPQTRLLADSNYRRIRNATFDCIVNAGSPTPVHQPGHAHADATGFCLHVADRPFIVDTGISTYERTARRLNERKSAAHNVLQPSGRDSAEVWAAFRMGRKPQVVILKDASNQLEIQQDGFRKQGLLIGRVFDLQTTALNLTEQFSGAVSTLESRLHFHPDVLLTQVADFTFIAPDFSLQIQLSGFEQVFSFTYDWCAAFNLRRPATGLVAMTNQSGAVISFQKLSSFTR